MAQGRTGGTKVLLCGYYGEHNLGDDALLAVLVAQLPPACELWITAHDKVAVAAIAPHAKLISRRSLAAAVGALRHVDVLVFGGGSLLQDSTSFKSLLYYLGLMAIARSLGVAVVLWGQGLGPLHRKRSRWLVRRCLSLATCISWRDPASLAWAKPWSSGTPMVMGPDPVWCHAGSAWRGEGPIILCWRPTPLLDATGWSRLLKALEQLLKTNDAEILWLAFHSEQDGMLPQAHIDNGLMPERVRSASRYADVKSVDEALQHFARARLVIPMRLHALILAQLAGAPCAALSYDPKVSAAAAMAEVPSLELGALPSMEAIAELWNRQIDHPPLPVVIQRIRAEAQVHQRMLSEQLSACDGAPFSENS